jgi:uncharacterized membrane protein YkoI
MNKQSTAILTLAGLLAIGGAGSSVFADETKVLTTKVETKTTVKHVHQVEPSQADLQKLTKITMVEARAIALKKAPGTIKSEELENEHGKLIYSFDISTGGTGITEVNVDAIKGKIIAVQKENAAKEAAEKKLEAKEAKAKSVKH